MTFGTFRDHLATLTPPASATFSVAAIGTSPRTFAAIDSMGRPALLVETCSTTAREVVRRGLRLQHRACCYVEAGVTQTITASLVVCEAGDFALQEAFISVGEIVLSRLSVATETEVAALLEARRTSRTARGTEPGRGDRTFRGVASFFTRSRTCRRRACLAYRNRRSLQHRLWEGRIEVKASGTRGRRHRFSFEQCVPDEGLRVLVASTLVLESSGGTGVRELATRVQAMVKMDADLTMKIHRAVLTVMGLPRPGEPRFDEAHAIQKLRWYDICEIPAVRTAPFNVDQIQFRVDPETASELSSVELERLEPAIRTCLPPE